MKTILQVSLLAMLLGGAGVARAADEPLTLDAAIGLAVTAAPQLQAQQAAIEGAQASVIGAGRLPDPELVVGVDNLPSNGMDAWSFGRDFMTMRKVGLMQALPSRQKRRSEQALARAQVAVAESTAIQVQLELNQAVAQAWAARHAAEVALQNLQQLQPQLALQVELARAAVASGSAGASVSEALGAQAAAAELDDRLIEARREVASAEADLARWIGAVAAARPMAPPPSFGDLHASAAELLSSLHHHAALLAFDARIAAATSEIAVASAAKRPDVRTELNYATRGRGYSDMVSLQFQIALPLFPGSRQGPAIEVKRAALRQVEADREAELRLHTAEINRMLGEWQSAKDRVELYERDRLPLARERSELALASLRAGRMDVRQSLAVLSEQITVEQSYAELLKTLGMSWAYLRYLPAQGEVQ